jgi:OmpA-OmpF porin, OOP family
MAQRRLRPGFFLGLFALAVSAWPASFVTAQSADTTADIVRQLKGLEAAPEIDVAQLRQQAADRIKSRVDAVALKRPPLSRELNRLPHINVAVQFNPDTPVIRPESYSLLGRIADALYDPALMSSAFLIVGRTESAGKRDYNLMLSQRRAEAIRDALVTTFKVSSKRLMAVGLGEEQLPDADHPKAAVNQQALIVTVK